jgi:hypothetical protein
MNQLSSILIHYFGVIARGADVNWDWEMSGEIEDAVERFQNDIDALVQQRVDEALALQLPEAIRKALQDAARGEPA